MSSLWTEWQGFSGTERCSVFCYQDKRHNVCIWGHSWIFPVHQQPGRTPQGISHWTVFPLGLSYILFYRPELCAGALPRGHHCFFVSLGINSAGSLLCLLVWSQPSTYPRALHQEELFLPTQRNCPANIDWLFERTDGRMHWILTRRQQLQVSVEVCFTCEG